MDKTLKRIAILGCGWLGFPLAEILLKTGYRVKGSTTTLENLGSLHAAGIEAYQIKVQPIGVTGDISSFLTNVEVLIIDFPPGIRNQTASEYIQSIQHLAGEISRSSTSKVIFTSSISVYEDTEDFPVYTERDKPNATSSRGLGLISAEEILASVSGIECTILRLAGLVGGERHPIYQLSGREGIANPEAPINLIHRTDCIAIIQRILEKESFGEVFNAAYPEHPEKEKYYHQKAKERSLPLPNFGTTPSKGKIINTEKLLQVLDYKFTRNI